MPAFRRRLLRGRAGWLEEFLWQLAFEQSLGNEEAARQQQDALLSHMTTEELEAIVEFYRRAQSRMDGTQPAHEPAGGS